MTWVIMDSSGGDFSRARHDEKVDLEESQAKTSQPASAGACQAKLAVTMLSISLANGEPWKYVMEGTFSFWLKKKMLLALSKCEGKSQVK